MLVWVVEAAGSCEVRGRGREDFTSFQRSLMGAVWSCQVNMLYLPSPPTCVYRVLFDLMLSTRTFCSIIR